MLTNLFIIVTDYIHIIARLLKKKNHIIKKELRLYIGAGLIDRKKFTGMTIWKREGVQAVDIRGEENVYSVYFTM